MVYLVNTLTKPMYPNLVEGDSLVISKDYNISYLNELEENYRVCINNLAILQTLEKRMGIDLKSKMIDKLSLATGDVVLVIKPSEKVEKLKEGGILPEYITFKLEEVIITEDLVTKVRKRIMENPNITKEEILEILKIFL